jgi:HEAT repeat protein
MKRIVLTVVGMVIWAPIVSAQSEGGSVNFKDANWIWYSLGPGVTLQSYPAGVGFFRANLVLPVDAQVQSAQIVITSDNLFSLYLNGHSVGECDVDNSAWQRPHRYNVADLLVPGRNVIAVEAVNTLPGPAGLLAKLVVQLDNGQRLVLASDAQWTCSTQERLSWQQSDFDDSRWQPVRVVGAFGAGPWGKVVAQKAVQPRRSAEGAVHEVGKQVLAEQAQRGWTETVTETQPTQAFLWPSAIIFVGEDCSLYLPSGPTGDAADSLSVTIFNPRKSRAFPEHDLPAPMKVGRKLFVLEPHNAAQEPRLLLDAGSGALGSPSASFDGQSILVSMAFQKDPFFHVYRLNADGSNLQQLTDGPFHDIDPTELPDGRIVFTSTRIGTFEEYHSPPSRALFLMNPDGSDIHTLTHTIIFDNEPEVLSDGRIIFVRSDNFFDRGKVETLLHAVHPDGSGGYTEMGLDNGPEYGGRLRAFVCGSPAPLPDGRLAFLSGPGITVGKLGAPSQAWEHFRVGAGDVAALPDGRLLCTLAQTVEVEVTSGKKKRTIQDLRYQKIGVLDPGSRPPMVTVIHQSQSEALHSPVYLGARPRPARLAPRVKRPAQEATRSTGFLFCQNARFTKNSTAGWSHVRAIRVLAGKGLTTRSSHSYIVHAGNETVELGTVPLAPDGSFVIEVPADTPLALQAVDAEGRAELNEMSWIYVRPGEQRGCVGCHHSRQSAPLGQPAQALSAAPLKLLGRGQPHRFRGNNAAVTGLMELQFDRYREVAGIDRYGSERDPLATGAQEVMALVARLQEADANVRLSAIQRLSVFRDPRAASALAASLRDRVREVRVAGAIALAACGTRDSIRPLVQALTDVDSLVAQGAALALENLTGHARPFHAFDTIDQRRQQALAWQRWFIDTPWESIEQALILRLEDSSRDVVRRAAVALGHIGSEPARVALRRYVTRERHDNPLPAWRKQHRGDGARFNARAAVNPRTLQAATRSLGTLADTAAVSLLEETAQQHSHPDSGNLFLAEATVQALGRIATPAAEAALVRIFAELQDYPRYTYWYGDHEALMACHASPIHYFIAESLDTMGSTRAQTIIPQLICSVPIDTDRALLLPNDDYETLIGRVIRRHQAETTVVDTCLALLGDTTAPCHPDIAEALAQTHRAWGGDPDPENRAAQILSLVCRDRAHEPRIMAAFNRYRKRPTTIPRVFDTGIPVVLKLPAKHWVCFYLARALGNLADPRSTDTLMAVLKTEPAEAATGRPDPLGPGVLFLHNDLTPCWRAATAWALGRIGDAQAVPVLLDIVADLDNATDTRHAAAQALGSIGDTDSAERIRELARDYPEISTRHALYEAVNMHP